MLANLAIELRVERGDRIARHLLAAEQHLFRLGPERPVVIRTDVRLRHPAPATSVEGQRIFTPRTGDEIARTRRRSRRATAALPLCLHRDQRYACEYESARRADQTSHRRLCLLLLEAPTRRLYTPRLGGAAGG